MGRPSIPAQSWYRQAAEIVVRQNVGLRSAVTELHLDLTPADCDAVYKSKNFQEILWQERNKHQTEVADAPGRSKSAAVGLALIAIQRLADAGEWDKVLTGIEKLAKIEGWMGAETQINLFGGLTAKDIAAQKERLIGILDSEAVREAGKSRDNRSTGDN